MTWLYLSPSLVDSWTYYRTADLDPETEARVLAETNARIRGEDVPSSPALRLGSAWHMVMEGKIDEIGRSPDFDSDAYVVSVEGEWFLFDSTDVEMVRHALPPGLVPEVWHTLELPEIEVRMRLRADSVGGEIHEHKSTSKTIDPDKYIATCQWRAYLEAFGLSTVVYHVAKLMRDRRTGVYSVAEYLPFRQHRYPDMRRDLVEAAGYLAAYIRSAGLASYRSEAWRRSKVTK